MAAERTPLAVSTPEEGDKVGDVASEVSDVAIIGDGVDDTASDVGVVAEADDRVSGTVDSVAAGVGGGVDSPSSV